MLNAVSILVGPVNCSCWMLFHVWNQSMENRKSVDVLFLDISKPFDKVPHAYLLEKLRIVGIDGSLLSWLRDCLTNRRQRCIVEGCVSGWLPVTSGVPQGIVLFLVHYFSSFTSMILQITSLLRWLFLLMTVSCLGRCKLERINWNCTMIWPN